MLSEDQYPQCSDGTTMTFYGKLDSISDDFCLADAGVVAVFVCFDCCETTSLICSS